MDIMLTLPDDLAGLDEAGLRQTLADIDGLLTTLLPVRTRCATLIEIHGQIAERNAVYLDARGGTVPEVEVGADISAWPAWVQPLGAGLGVYRNGDVRQHNGKLWRSSVDNNVWEPGVSQWTDITAELSPPAATPAAWSSTAGYAAGALVTYGGHTYRAKTAIVAGQYGALAPDNPVLWSVWELVS